MLRLSCNAKGLVQMFEMLQEAALRCNTYRIPKIHTIKAGEYSITDANSIFPSILFERMHHFDMITLNLIDSTTGRITGIIGAKHLKEETISETVFKIMESCTLKSISGIVIRYNNTNERKYLQYIPFAVIE